MLGNRDISVDISQERQSDKENELVVVEQILKAKMYYRLFICMQAISLEYCSYYGYVGYKRLLHNKCIPRNDV